MRPIPLFKHASYCSLRGECDCYLEFDDDALPDMEDLFFHVSPHVQGWSSSDLFELVHKVYGVYIGGGTSRNMSTHHYATTIGGSLIERGYSSWVALPPFWASDVKGCHREAAFWLSYTAYYDGSELKGFRLHSVSPAFARPEEVAP